MSAPNVSHSRHSVLVVDDDAYVREVLRDLLSLDGFDVMTAQDAEHAFEILDQKLPCMLLVDVVMPGMNGFEICRRLKADPRTSQIPIALVTGLVAEADIEEGLSAGAVDYIKKPFDRDEIRMRVRTQIRLHESLTEQHRLHKHAAFISAAATDAILIVDNEDNISHWNEAAERIFGYGRDEILGRKLHVLLVPGRFQATGEMAALGKTVELSAIRKSGEEFPIELSLSAGKVDGNWCAMGIVRDVTRRRKMEKKLKESEERFRNLFDFSRDAIMTLEPPTWSFTDGNLAAQVMFGAKDIAEFISLGPADLSPEKQPDGRASGGASEEMIGKAMREGSAFFEWTHRRIGGQEFPATVLLTRVESGGKQFVQATVRDISEQKRTEAELGHARKLEAVGQLAAGIAHEINTPAQYVGDSMQFLKEAFGGYGRLVGHYRRAVDVLEAAGGSETLVREIRETESDVDLPYLDENVPGSFDRCTDGISRIATIVRAMKDFAHPDQREQAPAELNQALQNTLTIAKNEYKYVADVETEFGKLPPVLCHVGDLNQVFLNLIVNAAHAIGDVVGRKGTKGRIRIRTLQEGDRARIDIADTGSGIPEAIRHRVFEPFFTTKEVGKGSGQGLAIARSIVVNKHRGSLTFQSEVGKGTTFTLRLPIGGRPHTENDDDPVGIGHAGRQT